MIPIKQQNRHRPAEGVWGDCHRAALASILELPLEEVPHFAEGGPDGKEFNRRIQEWLSGRGLIEISVPYKSEFQDVLNAQKWINPGLYYLLGGVSRSGVNH